MNEFKILKENGIVILKSDTVWGIFAKISEENRKKINMIKRSDIDKIISIAFATVEQAKEYVHEDHHKFLTEYPGRITKILKSSQKLKKILPLYEFVGVRVIDMSNLNRIIEEVGPLFTTSANISGEPTPKNSEKLKKIFYKKVDYIENGFIDNATPSKIYSYVYGKRKRIR